MSEPSPSAEKRTTRNSSHASSACEGCRARKIKCDEMRPSCNACLKRGTPCTWTVEKDRRTARGRACKDCEPLGAENARLNAEVARLLAENEDLKAQLANRTQAEPERLQAESVTDSPPKTPDALQDALSFQPLFAQFPWAPITSSDAASISYFQPSSFAAVADYMDVGPHDAAHVEAGTMLTMNWDEPVVFGSGFVPQVEGTGSAWSTDSF